MKPIVVIESSAILAQERLFARGAISALTKLVSRVELVLVLREEDHDRWVQAESVLEGEGVVFGQVLNRATLSSDSDELLESFYSQGRSIYLVGSGVSHSGAGHELVRLDATTEGWPEVVRRVLTPPRVGTLIRRTSETQISVRVDLDGKGATDVRTGIGFFDHMLEQVARHSGADISVSVSGDLHVDEHHTIEDTAIGLGEAFGKAIGDKRGIERYAFVLPMDDSLARVAFDWSGRSWLVWDAEFKREKIGDMPTEMFFHFFKSFCDSARCNLNVSVQGDNEHHMIESVFKAFGRCLGEAASRRTDDDRVPSTKGTL